MTELVIRCTGRPVDDHGQPAGEVCGRVFKRPVRGNAWVFDKDSGGAWWAPMVAVGDGEYVNRARSAGWAVGPDGNAMCPRCRRPDPVLVRMCADLSRK